MQRTRQKSEDRVVPEGLGNLAPTRPASPAGGGKAVPVKEEVRQTSLSFATADNAGHLPVAPRGAEADLSVRARRGAPKAADKAVEVAPATMEEVTKRLEEAFAKVEANQGAPGPDRQSIAEVRQHLDEILGRLRRALLERSYTPGDIRRVWIPKPGGGQRGLGIPNVVDRVVQEAVRQVLEPLYEPTFHPSSHGFRPGRGCQTAITAARGYVEQGYTWVVDLDLEKFFDRVHHQRLMARLAMRVHDKRLLVLLGKMLKAAVVLPDGVKVSTEEGVPQGGPLSPLLSNIVLDELDQELGQRGLPFVRYADDCNIYVRSERAGQRVMASITAFIERRLRLKVNADKSAVARPETRHFLGYTLAVQPDGHAEVLLSERSRRRLRDKLVELTPRNGGQALVAVIRRINQYLGGWFGHFQVCTRGALPELRYADAHLRRRMRAILLQHWRRRRTIVRNVIALGVKPRTAWHRIYAGHKSFWALSADTVLHRALPNIFFEEQGFKPLLARFARIWPSESTVAPEQPQKRSSLPVAVEGPRAPDPTPRAIQLLLPWNTARS